MASLHREAFLFSGRLIRWIGKANEVVFGPKKPIFGYVLAAAGLIVVGGLAFAATQSHDSKPSATPQTAHVSRPSKPSPAPSGSPLSNPTVAGTATTAPSAGPSAAGHTSSATTASSGVHSTHSTETSPNYVNLQIASGATTKLKIGYLADMDACSILTEAKNEGKIKSVTLVYYSSFQSYYVHELNGQNDNWTFKYNGNSPPVGCSKVPLHPDDTVTWTYNQ